MGLLQEIQVPLLAVNDTSLTVVEINFTSGSQVKKGDIVMVFETSKTTYDVEAASDGYIQYLCEADHDYEVNTVVARVYSEAGETAAPPVHRPAINGVAAAPVVKAGPASVWEGETLFSREATRLMTEAGVAPSLFTGRDFVTAKDVRDLLQPASGIQAPKGEPAVTRAGNAPNRLPLPADPQKVIVGKLSSAKKREIEYLGDIQSTGLTSTINTFVETNGIFTHINRSLKHLKDALLPVILYESARLLADYPLLNAYFTGDAIAHYKEVNPGFAIDIDKGLKVLKIARAGQLTIPAIEEEILRLSGSYLDDTLDIDDLTDITFTITDLSSEGVAFFRPLVNKMNSSILGISAIDARLQRCTLSLTFDHRVTEGKLAAQFLKELKDRLESYRAVDTQAALRGVTCFKCLKTLGEDLSGVGFARCITPEGKDGYICQSCLKGF
ncbi:MAG: 2-oxo acid dehydrogenase subunit E2 [Chitinophagaceae bacterium]|nr:2-oxo acid dehydrogenase subunit E2 [Chitinophagaceae bacterium]